MNPPGHPALAYDLLAVNRWGTPYPPLALVRHLFGALDASSAYAWERPLLAPLSGEIAAVHDQASDRVSLNLVRDLGAMSKTRPPRDTAFDWYGGNYIIIASGGVFVLMAHLRRASCRVRPGEHVQAGQPIASVGNSGQSIQPHLHIQAMSGPAPLPLFANLVPFLLSSGEQLTWGRWKPAKDLALRNGRRYRFS